MCQNVTIYISVCVCDMYEADKIINKRQSLVPNFFHTFTKLQFRSKRKQKMRQMSEIAGRQTDRMTGMFSCGGNATRQGPLASHDFLAQIYLVVKDIG